MIVTVTDFAEKTGMTKNQVYYLILKNDLPKGVKVAGIGKSKVLEVSNKFEHFNKLK